MPIPIALIGQYYCPNWRSHADSGGLPACVGRVFRTALLCLRVHRTPLTMSSTARCWPAAREKAALNSRFAFGPQRRSVLRTGWCAGAGSTGAARAMRMSERRDRQRASGPRAVAASTRACSIATPPIPACPKAHGLYDPALDKDSCGVGFIADIKGRKSHKIVAGRADHPAQPRASRRGRRRSARRRRRRHPGADPAQVLRAQGEGARLHAARSPASTASACCSCRATPSGAR